MATSNLKKVTKYEKAWVNYGMIISPGEAGDTVNISEGECSLDGKPYLIPAETALPLTPPSAEEVRANYIRLSLADRTYSVYATASGSAITELPDSYLVADAESSPDGENHQGYLYLGYVIVDDGGDTEDADIYITYPTVTGRGL